MKRRFLPLIALLLAAVFVICQPGLIAYADDAASTTTDAPAATAATAAQQFDELMQLYMQYSYYDKDEATVLEDTITNLLNTYPFLVGVVSDAMLKSGDPWSGYYDTSFTSTLDDYNGYVGFGFSAGPAKYSGDGIFGYGMKINAVFAGSPAEAAGLKAGDVVSAINSMPVGNIGTSDCLALISLYSNRLSLTVNPGGDMTVSRTVAMKPGNVEASSVAGKLDAPADAYRITISDFMGNSELDDFTAALQEAKNTGADNLILDVRGNPGGDLMTCLNMINLLVVPKDQTIVTLKYKDGSTEAVKSTGGGYKFKNVVVLTDGNSYSAAELFAVSLRDNIGAELIGKQTAGKAVGQQYFQLSSGAIVGITVLEIISPAGLQYNTVGIKPDVDVEQTTGSVAAFDMSGLNAYNFGQAVYGITSDAVLAVQQRLYSVGVLSQDCVTGKFDQDTLAAVKAFQMLVGVSATGRIDYNTAYALNIVSAGYTTPVYVIGDAQYDAAVTWLRNH